MRSALMCVLRFTLYIDVKHTDLAVRAFASCDSGLSIEILEHT